MSKRTKNEERVRRAFLGILGCNFEGNDTPRATGYDISGISSRVIRPSPSDKRIELLQDECFMVANAMKQQEGNGNFPDTGENVTLCHASAFGMRNFLGYSTTRLGRMLGVSTRLINYREGNESPVPDDDARTMAKQEHRQLIYISNMVSESLRLHEAGLPVPLFVYRTESEMRMLCAEMADMPKSAHLAITSCVAGILDSEAIPYVISERRYSQRDGCTVDVASSVYHNGKGSQELRFMRGCMDLSSTAAALMCNTNLRGWQYYEAGSADCSKPLIFLEGKYKDFRATVNRIVGEAISSGSETCNLRLFNSESSMHREYPGLMEMPMSVHHAALRQAHCILRTKGKKVRYSYE